MARAGARPDQPHALHRLERLGDRAEGRAPARHPAGHELLLLARSWVHDRPGMFTGCGLPDALRRRRRLADRRLPGGDADHRRVGDRHRRPHQGAARQRARADGYYGVFTANMHTDTPDHPGADAIVASAQARGVPVVSAKQMLTWLDGRNGSSFQGVSFAGGQLRFGVDQGRGASRPAAMVPVSTPAGDADAARPATAPPSAYTTRTVKGVDYAMFTSESGEYVATYGGAVPPSGGGTAARPARRRARRRSRRARRRPPPATARRRA